MSEEKIDLEKLRDEKCFPIVRNLFKQFPEGLIKEGKEQDPLTLKCLQVMLNADLNVGQEVSYVSQLILGVLSGLNKTVQECGLTNNDERYNLITTKILNIIVSEIDNIKLGTVTPEDTTRDFAGIKDRLSMLFINENLSQIEVKYIMDNIFDKYTTLNNSVQSSVANATEKMETKILGIETMNDLTLKKLNEVLISNVPK